MINLYAGALLLVLGQSAFANAGDIACIPPTQRENGTALAPTEIGHYGL